jgi:hypothetical protein
MHISRASIYLISINAKPVDVVESVYDAWTLSSLDAVVLTLFCNIMNANAP